MKALFSRLRWRIKLVRRFSAQAARWRDRPGLILAGIARGRPFGGDSLYDRMGRLVGRSVTPRIRAAGGARLHLRLDDLADLMIFEEIYLDRIYPLEQMTFTPDVIVDAGACTGMFTLLAHAAWPSARLIAIEPQPENYARLTQNLAENHVTAECHAAALCPRAGRVGFSGSGFGGHITAAGEPVEIVVPAITLTDLLIRAAPTSLLLKMDVEGAEREILPETAARLPTRTALFLETHYPADECRRFLAPLYEAGFSETIIRRHRVAQMPIEYVERLLLRPA